MRLLELLAPAKNLETGIAAIDHGADAVYIGAEHLGARAAAGNSVEDIEKLCAYASQFGVKVYVTLNTIIYEKELSYTEKLIHKLYKAGVDALIVQDMGITKMNIPPIELHASTQTDNRTSAKVSWLKRLGFARVVLARELSSQVIKTIHEKEPNVELEVFVHGALCVSYSGVCYVSQHSFNRSANRGECSQFCRMSFDLIDSNGKEIERQKHLLSLKDMCRIGELEELAHAGATSFKIEGRLKDVSYVKNVVSAYRKQLDKVIAKYPEKYNRASLGMVKHSFEPNLNKTFNRGFTTYFLHQREKNISSFNTPKAIGEPVGHVKQVCKNHFIVAGTHSFSNGDGLCFINNVGKLEGFRINRVEGNKLFPYSMPKSLALGTAIFRNNDEAFEKILAKPTASRKIEISIQLGRTQEGFYLQMSGEGLKTSTSYVIFEHQTAQKPQKENIERQLLKLGNTIYTCTHIELKDKVEMCFIPSSLIAELRRECVEKLKPLLTKRFRTAPIISPEKSHLIWQKEYKRFPYIYNISNSLAKSFYQEQGMQEPKDAFEVKSHTEVPQALLMQCKHCIRYSLGHCVKHGGTAPTWKEPLFLKLSDGRKFKLDFNCAQCQMDIYATL